MLRLIKHAVASVSIGALISAQILPAFAQAPDGGVAATSAVRGPTFTREDYLRCQTADEKAFREAIRQITYRALRRGVGQLNYDQIVTEKWRAGGLDEIVDQRIDIAAKQVREETSWGTLIKSLAYREQAKELAEAVAERTYRSDALKAALEDLATSVGQEIGSAIVLTTSDAAEPAQRCLDAYLGPRYGSTVARSVNKNANAAFEIDPKQNVAEMDGGALLIETSAGITGAVLLLVRRQMAQMARRLGQRLIGSVLGRLVSVVAGGVGLVLIAKEVWDLRHGVLPIITQEMKSAESKAKVRAELASSIREQIETHVDELAQRTADRIVDIWHDFRRAHAMVIKLAEQNAAFKTFVDLARPEQLPRLDEIVALILAKGGESAVLARLENGTLHTALNQLPEAGLQIAREQRSLDEALAWYALAGDDLDKVATHEIHVHASPDSFSRKSLEKVLALGDRLAVTRVAGVEADARNVLLELDRDKLLVVARTLTQGELQTLASYLTGLGSDAGQRILRMVAEQPARMHQLTSSRVREAILASRDQTAAVGMMLSDVSIVDLQQILGHVQLVWEGRVSPVLLWDKYPGVVIGAGVLTLVLLALLRGLFFGRRRRHAG
jgi:hypothetical protein